MSEMFELLKYFRERYLRLQARQRRAETEVDSMAERKVRIGVAADVELVGIFKLPGIPVGGANHG